MATPVPFVTQNQSLAIALECAGCRILDIQNRWTPETLKARGLKTIEEAATRGIDGNVSFVIERKAGMQKLIDAYNEPLPVQGEPNAREIEITPEDAMRFAKFLLVNRGEIAKWRRIPATWKLVEMDGEIAFDDIGDGEKRLTVPPTKVTPAFFKQSKSKP